MAWFVLLLVRQQAITMKELIMEKTADDMATGGEKKSSKLGIANIEALLPEDAQKARTILERLGDGVTACHVDKGPTVVRLALRFRRGVRLEEIAETANRALLDLDIFPSRVEAPIPGHALVGIEFPCSNPEAVSFSDVCEDKAFDRPVISRGALHLPVVFGKDLAGGVVVDDLSSAPHMLIGGAPGQGTRQFLHSLICGLVANRTFDEVQFIMVDPGCVELTPYAKLPNLVVPVINDIRRAVLALHWAVAEMENRLKMFCSARARNIADFNSRDPLAHNLDMFGDATPAADLPVSIPYIVIVMCGFDIAMEKVGDEIESDVQRLAALGRAVGIHLVLETEHPYEKAIAGSVMANIPVRVAFRTASPNDSMAILGDEGAESLMGGGDALVRNKCGAIERVQTPSITDADIANVVASLEMSDAAKLTTDALSRKDYRKAYEVVVKTQKASTSHLQRKMGIGYNHAAALIDELELNGVIGPATGPCHRKVLVDQGGTEESKIDNAIYVVGMGTDDEPRCRVGECALADVPEDAALVVSSPSTKEIFELMAKVVRGEWLKRISESQVEIARPLDEGISYLAAACDVWRIDKTPLRFKYEIVKAVESREPGSDFARKRIDAFNKYADKVTSAIHDAIDEAAEKGAELESVFFGEKFPAMRGTPKLIYKVEWRGADDVVVGGEMAFAQNGQGSLLKISERGIELCGDDGYNGASYLLDGDVETLLIDAIVAFFARCYKKRL